MHTLKMTKCLINFVTNIAVNAKFGIVQIIFSCVLIIQVLFLSCIRLTCASRNYSLATICLMCKSGYGIIMNSLFALNLTKATTQNSNSKKFCLSFVYKKVSHLTQKKTVTIMTTTIMYLQQQWNTIDTKWPFLLTSFGMRQRQSYV